MIPADIIAGERAARAKARRAIARSRWQLMACIALQYAFLVLGAAASVHGVVFAPDVSVLVVVAMTVIAAHQTAASIAAYDLSVFDLKMIDTIGEELEEAYKRSEEQQRAPADHRR